MLLTSVKNVVSNQLALHAMRRYRSRVGWRIAPKYEAYLQQCRAAFKEPLSADPAARAAGEEFRRDGITSLWTPETEALARSIDAKLAQREKAGETVWTPSPSGPGWDYAGNMYRDFPEFEQLFKGALGQMLTIYFQTWFKVFLGVMYKTVNKDGRIGSQNWHSDSGPGTCVNVMYYLHDTDEDSGTLEALPWSDSMDIYREETRVIRGLLRDAYGTEDVSKLDRLKVMQKFYDEQIATRYTDRIRHPMGRAGMLVPFLNNTLHRGGFPAVGHERRAIVFHFYPSATPAPFDKYRAEGIQKPAAYPKNPDF